MIHPVTISRPVDGVLQVQRIISSEILTERMYADFLPYIVKPEKERKIYKSNCRYCEKEIESYARKRVYCRRDGTEKESCQYKYIREQAKKNQVILIKKCPMCNKDFEALKSHYTYCHKPCTAKLFDKQKRKESAKNFECKMCSKQFSSARLAKRSIFCRKPCNSKLYNAKVSREKVESPKTCEFCAKQFFSERPRAYCHDPCHQDIIGRLKRAARIEAGFMND
jgi:hypothetical protein